MPFVNCEALYKPQALLFLIYHIASHHMLSYTEGNVQAFATLLLPFLLG